MESLRKIKKEMAEIKNTVTEIENTFDAYISRLFVVKERTIVL